MYGALEWEKPGKLYVVLQRFKSDRKQIRRGAACAVCRKQKRRCDGQRPCKSCVASKCEEKCLASGQDVEHGQVERPLQFQSDMQFRDPVESQQMIRIKSLKYSFLKGFWDMGFNEDALNEMFRHLPPRLQSVYKSLSQVFEAAISQAAQVPAIEDAKDSAVSSSWQDSVYCGWLNISFDETGKRNNVAMNRVLQDMWGAHMEEVMARTGNQDLPLPSSEFRTLCAIFDEFLTFTEESKTRYMVLYSGVLRPGTPRRPVLYRQSMQRVVRGGIPRRTTSTYVPVSPDQWDRALQQYPGVRNQFIDESFGLVGSQIQHNEDLWEMEKIANMVKTPEGRSRLEKLADVAMKIFQLPDSDGAASTASSASISTQDSPACTSPANGSVGRGSPAATVVCDAETGAQRSNGLVDPATAWTQAQPQPPNTGWLEPPNFAGSSKGDSWAHVGSLTIN